MDASLTAQSRNVESEPVGTTLKMEQFHRHDYFIVLFRNVLGLADYMVVIIAVIVSGTVLFALAPLAGPQAGIMYGFEGQPLLNMVRAVLQVFFIFPALTWISMSLPAKLASIFNTLHANGAIGKPCTSSSEYDAFLRKFVAWADNIWWFVGAVTLVALYWLYRLAVIEPLLRNHDGLWLRVAFLAISSFMLYAGFYSAVRILVALIFTNWLFHTFTIHVNPLHPDRSAGLGILGHMLTVSGILLIIMGVAGLVMNSSFLFDNDSRFSLVEAVILCTVYLTLAPSLLIGWLTMPHKVMVEARTVVLTDVAKEFQEATEAINSRAVDAETKASTKRLRQLRRRYKLLEETFPTWPLSIQTIRRLAAGVSLPALVPVIGALAGYLGKYLGFHF